MTSTATTSGCTCAKLRRLTRRVTAVYDRELAAAGMRVTQFSLLSRLRGREDEAMSVLADAMDMDRTTLTRNLRPLIEAGWVEVHADPADARVRRVRLTSAGEAQWQAARVHWKRAQTEVAATVGAAPLADLHRMLDACVPLFRPATGAEGDHA